MKKIIIVLGLPEEATEKEVLEAVKKLNADHVIVVRENERLTGELNEAAEKLAEAIIVIAERNQAIEILKKDMIELTGELKTTKETLQGVRDVNEVLLQKMEEGAVIQKASTGLSEDELQEIADEVLKRTSAAAVHVTGDGTVFILAEDATAHATKLGLSLHEFKNPSHK